MPAFKVGVATTTGAHKSTASCEGLFPVAALCVSVAAAGLLGVGVVVVGFVCGVGFAAGLELLLLLDLLSLLLLFLRESSGTEP